ncbi:MAG: hypothetical protein Q4A07_04660 [Coriobacteriales bacterium]|nr:hypothetical protein [Coriobacteriales bacterium]
MRKWMGLACAALCALTLALVGCAGTRVQGDKAGATANGAAGEHAQELEKALVKHWNLSRTEQDGLTIWNEDDVMLSLFLKEDGSATISQANGGAVFGRWEAFDYDDITFYKEEYGSSRSGGKRHTTKVYTAYPATYKPDTNELLLDAGAWDTEGTLCFSDGIKFMSERVSVPSSNDITDIKDASTLVGDWELFWVMDGDTVAEGQANKLATWKGYRNGTLTLAEGGKGTFLGNEVEWWMDEGFATMAVVGEPGKRESFDIEQLPNSIVVTSADDGNTDICYQFAKSK